MWFRPFFGGMIGGRDVDAFIRHREKNPEFSGMKTDGRRPHAAAGLHFSIARMRQIFYGMVDERPVDQIFGMQNRQSGRAVETGRGHKKIFADANYVRVGIVGANNRITKSSVAAIRLPRKCAVEIFRVHVVHSTFTGLIFGTPRWNIIHATRYALPQTSMMVL